jgi:ribonuclease D
MSRTTVTKSIEAAERAVLLETQAQVEAAAIAWANAEVLGIDTEFVRERTYRADLGLVQVSDGATAWLWDPLRFESSEAIAGMLNADGVTKVLHSGSEDLEVLLHAIGAVPEPLVDTQIACAMLGQPLQLSYQAAVEWLFGVEVEKDHTRSNWLKRPLKPGQLRYAAMDVVLLPAMYGELRARLEQAGRWSWLVEDVARSQAFARQDVEPEEAYLRIGATGRLDTEGRRAMRALASWREETAQARNRARGFVVSDAGLLELARLRPSRPEDLQAIEHLHPKAMERYGRQWLQVMAAAAADRTPVAWPEPLDNRQRKQLDAMRNIVSRRAKELSVDPALLASRRELERLWRAVTAGEPPPERFLGWRKAVITDDLLELIA